MFTAWGRIVVRYRRVVVLVAAVVTVFAGVWGTQIFGQLGDGGFDDPNSESEQAVEAVYRAFGPTDPNLIVLINSPTKTVDDPGYAADVTVALDTIPADSVVQVMSYFNTESPALVSQDRHSTYALIILISQGAVGDNQLDVVRSALTDRGYDAKIGGATAVNKDINNTVGSDIGAAEAISMPILLVLLLFIFGSVVSALLPLLVGGIAILGSFAVLRLINNVTEVSIFAVNLVTLMGLGLAIDYGLLIVGRFREELAAGHDTATAVSRTIQTAGRTVAISALTVAVSLSGLAIFPLAFLKSMAYGGISAVVVSAISAVLVLPAVLAMLGPKIEKWRVRKLRPVSTAATHEGFWFRLAQSVMHRPGRYLLACGVVLAFLFIPFFGVQFGGIDQRVLPATAEPRLVSDTLASEFGATSDYPIIAAVSVTEPVDSAAGQAAIAAYVSALEQVPGQAGVSVVGAAGTLAKVNVTFAGEPLGDAAKQLVGDIRAVPAPPGVQSVLVGGATAQVVDRLDVIGARLPWMGLLIAATTFILLFFAFGSVILPVKAILMNVLSLGASLGVVTWIFQDGHLSGRLNFTSTGYVEATQPILVLAIVFGLSMDYEVFLLARIREQWDVTHDNRLSVATGLQQTGRIISSAACLIIVVIAAFSASSISFIKLIGIAMLVAIIVDALLVRMFVVPATMRLLGDLNWWAPRPLLAVWQRFGFREQLPELVRRGRHAAPDDRDLVDSH